MAEGGLDEVDGGVAVQGVAGVGVAHPVGRHLLFQAGAAGGGVDQAADLGDVERSAALAAGEDGVLAPRQGVAPLQAAQLADADARDVEQL